VVPIESIIPNGRRSASDRVGVAEHWDAMGSEEDDFVVFIENMPVLARMEDRSFFHADATEPGDIKRFVFDGGDVLAHLKESFLVVNTMKGSGGNRGHWVLAIGAIVISVWNVVARRASGASVRHDVVVSIKAIG